jgi:hypothetical protein
VTLKSFHQEFPKDILVTEPAVVVKVSKDFSRTYAGTLFRAVNVNASERY